VALPTTSRRVTLDEIAERPTLATALTPDDAEVLLGACIAVQGALFGRLIATRGSGGTTAAAPRFVDAATAAKQWGVPESWIYDQARQGKLRSVRLGHYVRFEPDDLERFIADRRKDP
jgi:excisionase family DNA binding protein